MTAQDYVYIDTAGGLGTWLDDIRAASLVAVDTESDSFFRYREKVCLIQMTAGGRDAIIDPLAVGDISPLAALFADRRVTKVFHDAVYDLVCLRRDFGFRFTSLFDTMHASRLLGAQAFGLAALLKARFGFIADKKYQRSDWARRPLTAGQLDYARYDTHFLPELVRLQEGELRAAGRWAWAQEDFCRLAAGPPPQVAAALEESSRPLGFWRVAGARSLPPAARGRLCALWQWREQTAERLDRPAFKVVGEAVLLALAAAPPGGRPAPMPDVGLTERVVGRWGAAMQRAMEQATPIVDGPPPGATRRRRPGKMQDLGARGRYEALRELRRGLAQAVGLDPEVALGNALLEDLARRPPASVAEIRQRAELRGWRGDMFAAGLLPALGAPPAAAAG